MNRNFVASAVLLFAAAGAFAQSAGSTVQRDVNQQQRIENGLRNGSITTGEAARLEREEAKVDHLQAQALKDGNLTPAERTRLQHAQDKTSRDITSAANNGMTGDPQSASARRMQADVQRNINQEKRIGQGVQNGSLNNREVARLERGQAKVDGQEFAAGRDNHVGVHEQHRVQHSENLQSRRIFREKHDAQQRKG
ncbi:MAG TPA: hypothetical protein VFP68_19780 [Burkholderiaceae bacterium]|nr:hypothetical protein [Burkholderiaceae bacterium]